MFSVSATGLILNWSLLDGFIASYFIFNSASLVKKLVQRNTDKYADYQKSVPMFLGL